MKLEPTRIRSREDVKARLNYLNRIEKTERYLNVESGENVRERIRAACRFLRRAGLDAEAAENLFASVIYLTNAEMKKAWFRAYSSMLRSLNCADFDPFLIALFQIEGEEHVSEFIRANRLSRRRDPEAFPPYRSVDALEGLRENALGGIALSNVERQVLQSFLQRRYWVLLWDLNLSGKTTLTELRRLGKLCRILCPEPPRVLLCAAVLTSSAEGNLREIGLQAFSGLHLGEKMRVNSKNFTVFAPDMKARIERLCNDFFDRFIISSQIPSLRSFLQKGGTAFGYESGGWTLVTQQNCPNNSIPLLWADLGPDSYVGPFPRLMSQETHTSLARRSLDEISESALEQMHVEVQTYWFLESVTEDCPPQAHLSAKTGEHYVDRIFQELSAASSEAWESGRLVTERLLRALGREVSVWEYYLKKVDQILYQQPRDLEYLRRLFQDSLTATIDRNVPLFFSARPKAELLFRLTQLRIFNDTGEVSRSTAVARRVKELAEKLKEDDPGLSLYCALNLSVFHFNALDFAAAGRLLARWRRDSRLAGIGLRARGMYFSTLGQLHAFNGRQRQAEESFRRALRCFARLETPAEREREIGRTSCYRVINACDGGFCSLQLLKEALGGSLTETAARLAVSPEPRYPHHLLLRYLFVSGRDAKKAVDTYVSLKTKWSDRDVFPYPLIHLYRGLLLRNAGDPDWPFWVLRGFEATTQGGGGATLRYIAAVIGALAYHLHIELPQDRRQHSRFLKDLQRSLPQARDRLKCLQCLYREGPRGDVIKELPFLLPFYYR